MDDNAGGRPYLLVAMRQKQMDLSAAIALEAIMAGSGGTTEETNVVRPGEGELAALSLTRLTRMEKEGARQRFLPFEARDAMANGCARDPKVRKLLSAGDLVLLVKQIEQVLRQWPARRHVDQDCGKNSVFAAADDYWGCNCEVCTGSG